MKIGQLAKFNTPLPHENLDQLNVVIEVQKHVKITSRANNKALNKYLSISPINFVLSGDQNFIDSEMPLGIDHLTIIDKGDYSKTNGKIENLNKQKINFKQNKNIQEVITSICLTTENVCCIGRGNFFCIIN
ncbi:MAG: hypothetical protein LC127_11275 [Chitinophagales bacterium]|nr:hypothetical protein [Chitinophagales bacterium]